MGIDEKLDEVARHTANHGVAASEHYKLQSQNQLKKAIEKKINTTMIGAISAIENSKLGKLWGQGKPPGQLTENEVAWLAVKDALRTEILNNGNNQKRAAVAEINQYHIEWKRHHVEFTERNNKYE
jgi:hypothetical protein